jgi:hypothetical protein
MPVHRSLKSRRRRGAVSNMTGAVRPAGQIGQSHRFTNHTDWPITRFGQSLGLAGLLHVEAFTELDQDIVEVINLVVVVGRCHLDPKSHL